MPTIHKDIPKILYYQGGRKMRRNILKKIITGTMVAAIAISSFAGNPVSAEAKGTEFISKKVSDVTPKIVKFERTAYNGAKVTVKIPGKAAKVAKKATKKTAKKYTVLSPKVEVRLGFNKGKKFEAIKSTVNVKASGKNTYTFTVKHGWMITEKDTYISVSWKGNKSKNLKATNWSKLTKLTYNKKKFKYSNGGETAIETTCDTRVTCPSCGQVWTTEEYDKSVLGEDDLFSYVCRNHYKDHPECKGVCPEEEDYNVKDIVVPSTYYRWVKK